MGELFVDIWKTGGPMALLVLVPILALVRVYGDKEKLHAWERARSEREREGRRSRPRLEENDEQ